MKDTSFVPPLSVTPSPQQIVFIVGPTAVGKSAVACELARLLSGEIISCDAMQVYREAPIASDHPSAEMLRCVPHHVTGVISVEDEFNAARYRDLAGRAVEDVLARGKTPVICGGSGMYMAVLLDGIFEGGSASEAVRVRLEAAADVEGIEALYGRLQRVDPAAAQKIKPGDRRRVIRALEVFESTGEPISQLQNARQGLWGRYDIRIFCLTRERAELYRRAEARIEEMFTKGLVDEVKALLPKKLTLSSRRIIGVPEIQGYLEGRHDLERAQYVMKLNTRHYIKRQLTWFRKDKRLAWVDISGDLAPALIAQKIRGMLA